MVLLLCFLKGTNENKSIDLPAPRAHKVPSPLLTRRSSAQTLRQKAINESTFAVVVVCERNDKQAPGNAHRKSTLDDAEGPATVRQPSHLPRINPGDDLLSSQDDTYSQPRSGELIYRCGPGSIRPRPKQGLYAADGFGREQHVAANAAHFCRNVVDDDNFAPALDGVDDKARFVFPRASLNRALHGWLLIWGVAHLGGLGSYTVIKISSGWAVVQTMWSGRPVSVRPLTRQQAPRRCSG